MMAGLRQAVLRDRTFAVDLEVVWPIPVPTPWGVLEPVRGTLWGALISEVTGEELSLALHGDSIDLRRKLGTPPKAKVRRLPLAERTCTEKQCKLRTVHCAPGSGKLPECYQPNVGEMGRILYNLAMAWDRGQYVIVVHGPEFVVQ